MGITREQHDQLTKEWDGSLEAISDLLPARGERLGRDAIIARIVSAYVRGQASGIEMAAERMTEILRKSMETPLDG